MVASPRYSLPVAMLTGVWLIVVVIGCSFLLGLTLQEMANRGSGERVQVKFWLGE